jgi:hypothetical protein
MDDIKNWAVKIGLPAFVAISIKLAIQSKTMKMSWFVVITSFVTGVGAAYIFSDIVMSEVKPEYTSAVIAMIAISGEKIGYWLIYRFNLENYVTSFLEWLLSKVKG